MTSPVTKVDPDELTSLGAKIKDVGETNRAAVQKAFDDIQAEFDREAAVGSSNGSLPPGMEKMKEAFTTAMTALRTSSLAAFDNYITTGESTIAKAKSFAETQTSNASKFKAIDPKGIK